MDFLDKVYKKSDSIVSRKIADEYVLVPIKKNVGDLENIYTLNEVAARIWELIDGKRSVGDIQMRIYQEFEVTVEQAEKDVKEFLSKLEKGEIIERK
ncbi:MAG: PqqD family peptide modification chaperone [Candidatus Aminicenantes bacterium]|nr:PqqD family peptide modification chaperone [Candidatus Aminicenantes bacterium]